MQFFAKRFLDAHLDSETGPGYREYRSTRGVGKNSVASRLLKLRLEVPSYKERIIMNDMLLSLYVKFQDLKNSEEGQDLVEYALVVALIAFGATAGMSSLASGINTAFGSVSTKLGTAIS